MLFRIIDFEGNYLRDDFNFDPDTERGLEVNPPQGLYVPKWDGTQWIETGQEPEPIPHETTIEERLAQTEELLQTVTMAFTEYVFTQDMSDGS